MNVTVRPPWADFSEADALLIHIAQRIQFTRTMHEAATRNFNALCKYVDREGSPLHGKVLTCHPSGSFATGTPIVADVRANKHDVDAVLELDIATNAPPKIVLGLLFDAINGEPGGRYHGRVKLNSRCVTVEYEDGTKVDLMPIARLPGQPDRAGHLFHHKPETEKTYHKPVNPWAFAEHFNDHVEYDPAFASLFRGQRAFADALLEKAETQPMPDYEMLDDKSPRVVALQLIKRKRDLAFRPRSRALQADDDRSRDLGARSRSGEAAPR